MPGRLPDSDTEEEDAKENSDQDGNMSGLSSFETVSFGDQDEFVDEKQDVSEEEEEEFYAIIIPRWMFEEKVRIVRHNIAEHLQDLDQIILTVPDGDIIHDSTPQ